MSRSNLVREFLKHRDKKAQESKEEIDKKRYIIESNIALYEDKKMVALERLKFEEDRLSSQRDKKLLNIMKIFYEKEIDLYELKKSYNLNILKKLLFSSEHLKFLKDFLKIKEIENIETIDFKKKERDKYLQQYNYFKEKYGEHSFEAKGLKIFIKTFFPTKNENGEFRLPKETEIREIAEDSFASVSVRKIYTTKSWAILTEEMIKGIIKEIEDNNIEEVIDIGAGSGALVYWIRKYIKNKEIKIEAVDDNSWAMATTSMVEDIKQEDILEYMKKANKTKRKRLFIGSWITPYSKIGYEVLKEINIGDKFIYIGEEKGGVTGTIELHSGIECSCEYKGVIKNLSFAGIYDSIEIYEKNKEITEEEDKIIKLLYDDYSSNKNVLKRNILIKVIEKINSVERIIPLDYLLEEIEETRVDLKSSLNTIELYKNKILKIIKEDIKKSNNKNKKNLKKNNRRK